MTLFPVALYSRDSRASGSLHRGQRDRKAFQARAGQAQPPGGGAATVQSVPVPRPWPPPWAGEIYGGSA